MADDDMFDFTDSEDADAPFPPTYMIVRFAPDAQPRAIAWLVDKIRGPRSHGCAELLVRRQHTESGEVRVRPVRESRLRVSVAVLHPMTPV